ncbi:MAG: hypothetical protein WDM90_01025 [Ferruginibacter sp.]
MSKTTPTSRSVIGFKEVYAEDPPKNRLDILHGLCRNVVLGEIAGLKYRMKPKEGKFHDISIKFQQASLFYFCGSNKNLLKKYEAIVEFYLKNRAGILFSRPMCLFAFEEIRNSDLPMIPGFTMRNSWEQLLRYLLAVNNEITNLTEDDNIKPDIEEKDFFNLETLNPKLLPLNELNIDIDPLYIPFRGYKLMEYLSEHEQMGVWLKSYLIAEYGISFDRFIYDILGLYLANNKGGAIILSMKELVKSLTHHFITPLKMETLGF